MRRMEHQTRKAQNKIESLRSIVYDRIGSKSPHKDKSYSENPGENVLQETQTHKYNIPGFYKKDSSEIS